MRHRENDFQLNALPPYKTKTENDSHLYNSLIIQYFSLTLQSYMYEDHEYLVYPRIWTKRKNTVLKLNPRISQTSEWRRLGN